VVCTQFLPEVLPAGDLAQDCHRLDLDPVPRAAAEARRFVRAHAPALPEETLDSLELMTSELVTNAVLHARTALHVEVLVASRSLVVGVHDLDLATALQDPYAHREGGWGLGLVEVLAQSWSTERHPGGGKTVWFRLLRGQAHPVDSGAAARTDASRRDS